MCVGKEHVTAALRLTCVPEVFVWYCEWQIEFSELFRSFLLPLNLTGKLTKKRIIKLLPVLFVCCTRNSAMLRHTKQKGLREGQPPSFMRTNFKNWNIKNHTVFTKGPIILANFFVFLIISFVLMLVCLRNFMRWVKKLSYTSQKIVLIKLIFMYRETPISCFVHTLFNFLSLSYITR